MARRLSDRTIVIKKTYTSSLTPPEHMTLLEKYSGYDSLRSTGNQLCDFQVQQIHMLGPGGFVCLVLRAYS